ncbi:MAG TPA: response regulator [Spirochaetota bacterium]|jgi:DNA-binding NarL/FixJ family response regulator|nr:response regulator [Spirochaetota bacterium]HQP47496.1 response regulator [Spirochaetota bacterium]
MEIAEKNQIISKTVYIVEDSFMVRGKIVELLSGYRQLKIIGMAERMEDAIKEISYMKPDISLIDIGLKSGSGIGVLKSVKENSPDTVCIMLTNYTDDEYRQKCDELGADYFFDKTIEFEEALGVIISL